jgi:uncharacterized protein (DUF885 family)
MQSRIFGVFGAALAAILVVGQSCPAQTNSGGTSTPSAVEARKQKLKDLMAEEWEFELRESPLSATSYGDYRYNDKLDDFSIAEQLRIEKDLKGYLARLDAIDAAGFGEQDQLNKVLLERKLHDELQDIALKNYEMPVDQFNGVQLELAQLPTFAPLDSVKHYEDYLARLRQIPRAIDQVIGVLQLGEKDGLMPPKFLLEETVKQCDSIAAPAGGANSFAVPIQKFPAAIPAEDQKRLHDAIVEAIDTQVRPAYVKLGKFIEEDYAPKGRAEPGVWALPDGDARYRNAVREMTTTDMTPEQIYELGMTQVKENEAEMNALAKRQGYADWKAYGAAIQNDPKMMATSRGQVLDEFRGFIAQMQPKLPELFELLPKAKLEVVPVEEYREKEASLASYEVGTPDGSRPGKVYVNTGDYKNFNIPGMESIAYHEGVPGHHMQLSIQQELPDLPAFRQHGFYTAYGEGWALYAERLGKEMGFYQNPNNDFERLASELFRATRLVEDTGVHYKHWTRDQMVQFFHDHSLEAEADLQSETDRYIAWPGQALSYKIGQLKILELRKRAQDQLGDKFDIRAFHDEMLSGGAMPLDVLDARTNAWIASVKSGTNATGGK